MKELLVIFAWLGTTGRTPGIDRFQSSCFKLLVERRQRSLQVIPLLQQGIELLTGLRSRGLLRFRCTAIAALRFLVQIQAILVYIKQSRRRGIALFSF